MINNTKLLEKYSYLDSEFEKAVKLVVDRQQVSASMMQRVLKLGYARAARLVDQMEEIGIIGEADGANPRKVLIKKIDWSNLNDAIKKAKYYKQLETMKRFVIRIIKILAIASIMLLLSFYIGLEIVLLIALAIIIEHIFSKRFYW